MSIAPHRCAHWQVAAWRVRLKQHEQRGKFLLGGRMKLLSVKEAAEILGVTAQGIHKMIGVGVIKANKHSGVFFIERKEVTNAFQRRGRGRPRKNWA